MAHSSVIEKVFEFDNLNCVCFWLFVLRKKYSGRGLECKADVMTHPNWETGLDRSGTKQKTVTSTLLLFDHKTRPVLY